MLLHADAVTEDRAAAERRGRVDAQHAQLSDRCVACRPRTSRGRRDQLVRERRLARPGAPVIPTEKAGGAVQVDAASARAPAGSFSTIVSRRASATRSPLRVRHELSRWAGGPVTPATTSAPSDRERAREVLVAAVHVLGARYLGHAIGDQPRKHERGPGPHVGGPHRAPWSGRRRWITAWWPSVVTVAPILASSST